MPSKYTREQQNQALLYADSFGSASEASARTGIPERTIRYWRQQQREEREKWREDYLRESQIAKLPEKSSDCRQFGNLNENQVQPTTDSQSLPEQLQTLRDQIMQHTFILSQSLSVDDERINERAIALTRLIDRVLKLETAIQQSGIYKKDQVVRIEYVYPDKTVHDVPKWMNPDYKKERRLYDDDDQDQPSAYDETPQTDG